MTTSSIDISTTTNAAFYSLPIRCMYVDIIMNTIMDNLSATAASAFIDALCIRRSRWIVKTYLNPLRDMPELEDWFAKQKRDGYKIMLVGADVEVLVGRIRNPHAYSQNAAGLYKKIRLWVLVIPRSDEALVSTRHPSGCRLSLEPKRDSDWLRYGCTNENGISIHFRKSNANSSWNEMTVLKHYSTPGQYTPGNWPMSLVNCLGVCENTGLLKFTTSYIDADTPVLRCVISQPDSFQRSLTNEATDSMRLLVMNEYMIMVTWNHMIVPTITIPIGTNKPIEGF